MKYSFILFILFLLNSLSLTGQIVDQTGFESWADEHQYLQSSWVTDGFSPRWVNGFNQSRAYVDNAFAASGSNSLRITFPSGSFGPSNNGAQAPLDVPGRLEYYISYWVRFSDNFDWGGTNEGGKLPGLAGGNNCSGCATCNGTNGFSARLMWRPAGRAVLYLYHMDKTNACGDNLNLRDINGNIIHFAKGTWYNIIQRVKVNTGTANNGEVEVWVNGVRALLVTGLKFVTNGQLVDNFYFSTFHGGGDATWAPGVTCHAWFDDIKIAQDAASVFPSLPVELTSLDAILKSDYVQVKWSTASELNNSHFIVERSEDGVNFSSIAHINGNGSTSESHTYIYNDFNFSRYSDNYYRLKQYNLDGSFSYSKIVNASGFKNSVNEIECLQETIVYPNPFHEFTSLFSSCEEDFLSFKLYHISGKLIKEAVAKDGMSIGEDLSPGMYILEIVGQEKIKTIRLIKN